ANVIGSQSPRQPVFLEVFSDRTEIGGCIRCCSTLWMTVTALFPLLAAQSFSSTSTRSEGPKSCREWPTSKWQSPRCGNLPTSPAYHLLRWPGFGHWRPNKPNEFASGSVRMGLTCALVSGRERGTFFMLRAKRSLEPILQTKAKTFHKSGRGAPKPDRLI